MDGLRIEPVDGERMMLDWQHVHNTIIPTAPLMLDEVRERTGRNHLEVAYLGDAVVGCSTVRPPTDEDAAVVTAAAKHGFVEVERYVLPGDTIPFVTLRLDRNARHP